MSHKHDHKKDKDAFESQIGTTGTPETLGPTVLPGLQQGTPDLNRPSPLSSSLGEEKKKDDKKEPSGLTHAAGEAMAHWSESAGTNKAPMDSLTVADRERKMNKKKGGGDADEAKGNDHDKDKGAKEQTVS